MREPGHGARRRAARARAPKGARARSGRRSTRSSSGSRGAPLDDRVRQQPPPRRAARAPAQRARREGRRPRAPRLARARAARRDRGAAQARRDPVPRRDVEPRARHRHGRGRPRGAGRVPEVGGARTAAHRPRGPRARRRLEGPHLPEVPRRPARGGGRRAADARGRDRGDRVPRNPLDVLAQQIVAMAAAEEIAVDELHALVRRAYPFADLSRPRSGRARHARRALPLRRVRRAAAADRLGPHRRPRARPRGVRRLAVTNAGTIPDRGLFGVHSSTAAAASASSTRRWSTRRGRARRSSSARRPGDRGDHARPGDRLARAGRPRQGAVLARRGLGRPFELGARSAVPARARRAPRRAGSRAARRRVPARRARGAGTCWPTCASSAATPAVPTDRTIMIERFRDELGDCRLCILSPFGGRVHAPWALALEARLRERRASRFRRCGPTTGSRCASRTLTSCRRPRTSSRSGRARGAARRRARAVGPVRRPLPRERGARAAVAAAPPGECTPLWAQRLRAQRCCGGASTVRFRSFSRPIASACRTCSTCPR